MTLLATAIPGSSNNGYVAAAYIVFFAIVLIYVAIMALRLSSVERGLRELNERTGTPARQDEMRQDGSGQDETHSQARERETV
jgi:hypothetical protein